TRSSVGRPGGSRRWCWTSSRARRPSRGEPPVRPDAVGDRELGRGWQARDGERPARQAGGRPGAVRASTQGSAGSLRRSDPGAACPRKIAVRVGQGRYLMVSIQQGLRDDGFEVSMVKNTVQRIFQLMGWQVRKRSVGCRPRIQALPSVAQSPDGRWATDLCRIWAGRDVWMTLALVIDCYTRQLLGWHLSRSGKVSTAAAALEQALINRFGTPGRVHSPFLLRSDNGLVFTSLDYTRLVRNYGLRQEFITPHCPQQDGMVERVIRTLKEQCAHR